jgi:hypothetical protein
MHYSKVLTLRECLYIYIVTEMCYLLTHEFIIISHSLLIINYCIINTGFNTILLYYQDDNHIPIM